MGTTFQATTKAAEAPELEAGMADLKFTGTSTKLVTGGQFQKNEKGDLKLVWAFTVLDDAGNVLREDREDSENFGKPIVLEKLTGTGFNIASKTVPAEVKVLKALMSPAEFADFENGAKVVEKDLLDRVVQGEIFIKDNGWPGIGNVVGPRKKRSTRAAAAAEEE